MVVPLQKINFLLPFGAWAMCLIDAEGQATVFYNCSKQAVFFHFSTIANSNSEMGGNRANRHYDCYILFSSPKHALAHVASHKTRFDVGTLSHVSQLESALIAKQV